MKSRYDQVREDHEYLWQTYGEAYDMTGGYVDSDDLKTLLEHPTKAKAADLYEKQIHYWFDVGPDHFTFHVKTGHRRAFEMPNICRDDPRVIEIAERYGFSL